MGTFTVPISVGDRESRQYVQVEALVDTGASDTVLPQEVLRQLDIRSIDRSTYRLADGRVVEYEIGEARIRIDGGERTALVVFGPEGTTALLGATTLEVFHLSVDPVEQVLRPVPGLRCEGVNSLDSNGPLATI